MYIHGVKNVIKNWITWSCRTSLGLYNNRERNQGKGPWTMQRMWTTLCIVVSQWLVPAQGRTQDHSPLTCGGQHNIPARVGGGVGGGGMIKGDRPKKCHFKSVYLVFASMSSVKLSGTGKCGLKNSWANTEASKARHNYTLYTCSYMYMHDKRKILLQFEIST